MSPQVSWDMTTYHFPHIRLLVRWWTEVCNSSFPNGYKYPGQRRATYPHKPEDTSTYPSAHEANVRHGSHMLYIQYSEQTHMYVDTQTRTPTDVLADLIVRELYSQVRYAFLFESSTSS